MICLLCPLAIAQIDTHFQSGTAAQVGAGTTTVNIGSPIELYNAEVNIFTFNTPSVGVNVVNSNCEVSDGTNVLMRANAAASLQVTVQGRSIVGVSTAGGATQFTCAAVNAGANTMTCICQISWKDVYNQNLETIGNQLSPTFIGSTVPVSGAVTISSGSISLTSGSNEVTLTGVNTVTVSGATFSSGDLNTRVNNVVSVTESMSGGDSPVYPNRNVILPFPVTYNSPVYGNVMPNSAFFHGCVNETGLYETPTLFYAPNGTCGFSVSVSVSQTTSTPAAVLVAGVKLNSLELALAEVVGTGTNTNYNEYMDSCSGQANTVFLNTTMASGVACVDITIASNEGASAVPAGTAPVGLSLPDGETCISTTHGYSVCNALLYGNVYVSYLSNLLETSYTVQGYVGCTGLGVYGVALCLTGSDENSDRSFPLCAIVTQGSPFVAIKGYFASYATVGSGGEAIFCIGEVGSDGQFDCKSGPVGNNVYCYLYGQFATTASVPVSSGSMYATSSVDGPPQQWYYPLDSDSVEYAKAYELHLEMMQKRAQLSKLRN